MTLERAKPVTMPDESWTAMGNAAARAAETERPDRICADPLARAFLDAAGPDIPLLGSPEGAPDGGLLAMIGDVIAIKTRFFDEYFHRVCATGCRQVVLLAAGLDSRAFRLAWPPGTTVFEVDLPGILSFKERVLTEQRAEPGCLRTVVPADLRDDWPGALLDAGFDRRVPTAWLAEGTLGFLDAAGCDGLLASIAELSAPSSWFALDHTHDGSVSAPRLQRFLDGTGVSLAEMVKGGPTEPADRWLARSGWSVTGYDVVDQAAGYGRPAPALFRGERGAHGRILFQARLP
ncbi:class I SAM-dependent methyltransferase [Amycolatopsis minnesotensis]|uniref:S-adenosyl-L-methionine-dependent methyltransferase n=1 Tax=Amycolatopsis minnesotensis TaxID=337894 RepID=A0ABN2QW84_9PSEU